LGGGARQPPAAVLQMPQGLVRERVVEFEQLEIEIESA
jgi:hypothetical protein